MVERCIFYQTDKLGVRSIGVSTEGILKLWQGFHHKLPGVLFASKHLHSRIKGDSLHRPDQNIIIHGLKSGKKKAESLILLSSQLQAASGHIFVQQGSKCGCRSGEKMPITKDLG